MLFIGIQSYLLIYTNWFVELWASFSRNKYEHYLYFYFHFQQTKNGNFKKEISSYLFNNVQKVT